MLLWSWIFCWECNSTKILNGMNLFVTFDRKLKTLTKFEFLGLFFIRIYLAYIFWIHGNSKLTDVEKFSSWLGSIDIPFPDMVAWMLISSELIGALLLLVGRFVRCGTLPLLTPMILAISFVNLMFLVLIIFDNKINAAYGSNNSWIRVYICIIIVGSALFDLLYK